MEELRELLLNNNITELVLKIDTYKNNNHILKLGIGQIYNNFSLKDLIIRIEQIDINKIGLNKFLNLRIEKNLIDIEFKKYTKRVNFDNDIKKEVKNKNINCIDKIFAINDFDDKNKINRINLYENRNNFNDEKNHNDVLFNEINMQYKKEARENKFVERNYIQDVIHIENINNINLNEKHQIIIEEQIDNNIIIDDIPKIYNKKRSNYIKYFY